MKTASLPCRQRGLSLFSLLLVGAVLGFALLMALRSAPAITEYLALKRIVAVLAAEGDSGRSEADLRASFDRRGQVDDIVSVSGADLRIDRELGRTVVEVEYVRSVPIVRRLSLQIGFHVSSRQP